MIIRAAPHGNPQGYRSGFSLEGSSFRSLLTSFSPDCVPLIDLFTLSSALESFVVSPPISTVMPRILDAICVTTSSQA